MVVHFSTILSKIILVGVKWTFAITSKIKELIISDQLHTGVINAIVCMNENRENNNDYSNFSERNKLGGPF